MLQMIYAYDTVRNSISTPKIEFEKLIWLVYFTQHVTSKVTQHINVIEMTTMMPHMKSRDAFSEVVTGEK